MKSKGIEKVDIKYAFAPREENSFYTKPNCGLVIEYLFENQISNISNIVFVGDSKADEGLANNMNFKFLDITKLDQAEMIRSIKKEYDLK